MNDKKNNTINNIAMRAGVSKSTISRVLNNTGYVSENTRKKVEAVINETNFTPSAAARSLSMQDSSAIGVIIPEANNPYFGQTIEGISQVLDQQECFMVLFNTRLGSHNEAKALAMLSRQRPKGIIITPAIDNSKNEEIQQFKALLTTFHAPIVFMDSAIDLSNWDIACNSHPSSQAAGPAAFCEAPATLHPAPCESYPAWR